MLADQVDHIIGVDTHKDSHTIAVVSPAGAVIAHRLSAPTPSATCPATGSPSSRRQDVGSGRSRAPAATGPGSPPTCSSRVNGWPRSTVPPARRAVTAPPPMTWTLLERPTRRSAVTGWPSHAGVATGKLSTCCRPPATARWGTDLRDQPPQGAGRQRTPAPARAAARAGDRAAAGPLRWAAQPPNSADRVSRHDHRAAPHRPARARPPSRGRRSPSRARHARPSVRRAAAGRAGRGVICATQLLTAWSHAGRLRSEAAFARRPPSPCSLGSADRSVVRQGRPPPPQPKR
jgi:hypothetical protein